MGSGRTIVAGIHGNLHVRVSGEAAVPRVRAERVHLHAGPLELARLRGGRHELRHPRGGPRPVRGAAHAQGVPRPQVSRRHPRPQDHCERHHLLGEESAGCHHSHNLRPLHIRSNRSPGGLVGYKMQTQYMQSSILFCPSAVHNE